MELSRDRLRSECVPDGTSWRSVTAWGCVVLNDYQNLTVFSTQKIITSDDGRWLFRAVALYACQNAAYLLYSQEAVFGYSFPFQAYSFLGAFAELRKATISFVKSVRMEQLGSHCTDFHEIWYLSIFRKSVERIQDSWKSDKTKWYFTWRPTYIFDQIWLISS